MLSIDQLSLGYDQRIIVQPVSHQFTPGKIYALVGPNGSGKSTLLRGLAGYIAPRSGSVTLDGKLMQEWGARERAKRLAFLSQTPQAPDGMNVEQLVASGRYPHQRYWSGNSAADQAILTQAMSATELMDYKDMPLSSLSGGERQRAWIAMTLAQQAKILLLDEPTTYLDVRHQLDILNLLHGLSRQYGLTIIMVLHDINQACEYADELLVMQEGQLQAHGSPAQVMSLALLRDVFGIEASKIVHPSGDAELPCFIPLRSVA